MSGTSAAALPSRYRLTVTGPEAWPVSARWSPTFVIVGEEWNPVFEDGSNESSVCDSHSTRSA